MKIEELFGTLQMSVVSGWRKHLRSAKYGKHVALQEFYEEMPDKVDALIEAWMGANGKKVGNFTNILTSSNMNTLSYLKELKKVCKDGYELLDDNEELESLLDDIVNLINSTLYKVKELAESNIASLTDFINEQIDTEDDSLLEGYGNSYQFGDISREGQFIDYFGEKLSVGDKIVFLSQDFKDSKDFYRAVVDKLVTDKGGTDYVVVKQVESPHSSGKVKDGSKKRSDLCIKMNA